MASYGDSRSCFGTFTPCDFVYNSYSGLPWVPEPSESFLARVSKQCLNTFKNLKTSGGTQGNSGYGIWRKLKCNHFTRAYSITYARMQIAECINALPFEITNVKMHWLPFFISSKNCQLLTQSLAMTTLGWRTRCQKYRFIQLSNI
jgi:hypothetical protein